MKTSRKMKVKKEEENTKRADNLGNRAMVGMDTSDEGKSAKRSKDE